MSHGQTSQDPEGDSSCQSAFRSACPPVCIALIPPDTSRPLHRYSNNTCLAGDRGYHAIQAAIGGVGQTSAAVFVAEIGDVTRFVNLAGCVLGGVDARHRESDTIVHRGHIMTKQGSTLVCWAAIEAGAQPAAQH
jgi:transposase IS116/IS110/IS902 family protein